MDKPNYLSRHEIGEREIEQMKRWQHRLTQIVRPGGSNNKHLGISDTIHFNVELRRVNKWLRGVGR